MLQYALIFESVRIQMPFPFIVFLFIFLSTLSSLYSFFFSLLSHSSSDIAINPSLLSLFFLLIVMAFLSSVQPRRSLLLWVFFFFFCSDLIGGFGSGWLSLFHSASPHHLMPISVAMG